MRNQIYLLLSFSLLFSTTNYAQQVAINEDGSSPSQHAILDIKSFNKGVLLPRTSTAARLAIPNTKGLLVYDTTTHSFWYNTGNSWQSMAGVPPSGNSWQVSGNSGTGDSHFLGTLDSVAFKIKVNNQLSGLIDPVNDNTFWGYKVHAVNNPNNYYRNTAFGARALYKNAGPGNTAAGYEALYSNLSYANTGVGSHSLYANTTGYENTAIGTTSLAENTTGFENTSVGFYSMIYNRTGRKNTAIGWYATPIQNSAMNATAIGYQAIVNYSNKIRLGNAAVAEIEGQVPFSTPSDGRFKYEVKENVGGLDFIMQLRPVTYHFDARRFDEQLRSIQTEKPFPAIDEEMKAAYEQAAAIRRSGFIAQEVEKAAGVAGYDFSGLIKPKTEKDYYSISYESFVPSLVKAIQELYKKMEELQNVNDDLKYQLKTLMLSIK
ncbi:MAG: tail fiber domain-containing protein [Chitinophagaceae bacterium]